MDEQINYFDTILKIIVGVGIPAIMGAGVYIGRKLQMLDTVQGNVENIKGDCEKIWEKINGHGEDITGLKIHTNYGVSKSPTVPNEEGEKVLTDSNFYKIYPELRKEIFSVMDKKKLRTLYDYEKGGHMALHHLENNPLIDPLKDYAVNHPDVSLELIFVIASWIIRDDYNKYKEEQSGQKGNNQTGGK